MTDTQTFCFNCDAYTVNPTFQKMVQILGFIAFQPIFDIFFFIFSWPVIDCPTSILTSLQWSSFKFKITVANKKFIKATRLSSDNSSRIISTTWPLPGHIGRFGLLGMGFQLVMTVENASPFDTTNSTSSTTVTGVNETIIFRDPEPGDFVGILRYKMLSDLPLVRDKLWNFVTL